MAVVSIARLLHMTPPVLLLHGIWNARAWVGPLAWRLPSRHASTMDLDADIAGDIRARALARSRGHITVDPLDAHRDLSRLKVAGLLAILAQRLDITATDWELAGVILDASDRIRSGIVRAAHERARDREQSATSRLARQQAGLEEAASKRAFQEALGCIVRHAGRCAHDGGAKKRCLQQATNPKKRGLFDIDDVLERAIEDGLLHLDGDVYRPGPGAR